MAPHEQLGICVKIRLCVETEVGHLVLKKKRMRDLPTAISYPTEVWKILSEMVGEFRLI